MKKKILILTLCLIMSLTVFSCGTPEEAATEGADGAYSFTDAMGNEVTVENPQNVVACMGGLADIWMLAGGEASLKGIAEDAGFEVPTNVATVGKHDAPSVESILALNPDFVILSAATDEQVALADTLKQAGINYAYFDVNSFEDYLNTLKTFSDITGDTAAYKEHGVKVQEQIDGIIADAEGKEAPSVLLLITYSQGVRAQTSESMTGAMLKDLGCTNIADENPSLLQSFSVEAIVDMDPEYILVVPMGYSAEAAEESLGTYLESNPAWAGLSAVKNGNYQILAPSLFMYKPNEQWGESYAKLSEIIYGE
ncbi:MAG: ABC transporter substrate-binding protein [Bacillota bacterium]|jgi:iron complex transport system substrate-binding protein